MVNYFIYAKDFSGSTGGSRYFHSNGRNTLDQFKKDVESIKKNLLATGDLTESKIIYLHWGDRCYKVDEEITKLAYDELECGHMGTDPETIIEWIQQNFTSNEDIKIKLLYIITDGMINYSSVQKCYELNENMHYETFVFHAINEDVDCIDMSVASSFLKGRCMIYRNNVLYDNINISEQLDYDKINVNNFATEKENMKSYIRLKYIKKLKHDVDALQEIEKLKKLRDRLFKELSSKLDKTDADLETKEKNKFVHAFYNTNWYKNLYAPSQGWKVEIEKSISTLIHYIVSDTKSYSFDALKFDTTFHNPVEEEPIVDVNFTAEQEIEFPDIILDDDRGIPVIILAEFNLLDKTIFHKAKGTTAVSPASFNKFKSAMDCPLFLINDPDISESIGYFYTLNVYKQLLSNGSKTEPRTRRPFHGGLVLTDTDEFDKYNDYILSATYFDSRKVHYNIGLFYFVLWKNCENKEWMDRNVVDRFKKYVMRRISETKCKIGLSSLPLDPPEITSLPTALWYCVEVSSIIFKDDPVHFMQERLRMCSFVAHYMIEILKYFGYDLELETIEKRIDLIRHVMILKRIPQYREKVYYLLERMFKNVNGFLISEIEKPFNLNKLNYLKCDHKGMLNDDVIEGKVNLNDYVHLMHFVDNFALGEGSKEVEICENTFRPFFTINENKSFYTELVKVTKKIVITNAEDKDKIKITFETLDVLEFDKIMSLFNIFINCVKDSERYPTLSEYVGYIWKKKKFNEDLVRIFPANIYNAMETVYSRYENIMRNVNVNTFIEVSNSYVRRSERIKAENIVKFKDNKEIDEFISNQEDKVNLKKKVSSDTMGSIPIKKKRSY